MSLVVVVLGLCGLSAGAAIDCGQQATVQGDWQRYVDCDLVATGGFREAAIASTSGELRAKTQGFQVRFKTLKSSRQKCFTARQQELALSVTCGFQTDLANTVAAILLQTNSPV